MMTRATARRGFTLVELLVSLVVTAIVGGALVRMVLSQARFMDQQEAWRGARSVARGGINRLLSDLRVVEAGGGVFAAVAGGQDFTINVPYAFGIICSMPLNNQAVVSMLPVDAQMYAALGHTGFAIRRTSDGGYNYYTSQAAPLAATGAQALNCTAPATPADLTIATGNLLALNGSPNGQVLFLQSAAAFNPVPKRGEILFLYRRIRYQFKNSALIPGRTGLFRMTVTNNVEEELATPFANTARVNFYNLNTTPAQAAVPPLGNIRGLELILDGMSERTPGGSAAPKTANVRTSVFFENRID
jgi:prepilin-type N-terminal cleavage/methylation domain-containing protein